MRHFFSSLILFVAITSATLLTSSCSDEDNDCITVEITRVEDERVYARALGSREFYYIEFDIKDLGGREVQGGDIIDIHLIEYETPTDVYYPMFASPPIVCILIELCK